MNLKQQRATALKAAHAILDGAKNRDLTKAEHEGLTKAEDKIRELDAMLKRCDEDRELMAKLGSVFATGSAADDPDGNTQRLCWDSKQMAGQVMSRDGERVSVKALTAPGQSVLPLVLVDEAVLPQGRPPASVLDALPASVTKAEFAYLRQTERTHNAAVVARGDLKPTSTYSLERVTDRLRVVAHLSEGIDKYLIQDLATLSQFVQAEMLDGLRHAVEAEVINGDGTDEHMLGFANTSGIQAQAAGTDRLATTRTAITKTETLFGDPTGGLFVMNPLDWQAIELMTLPGSGYALNGGGAALPVEMAARKLWGQQVATSTAVPAGTAYWLHKGAVVVWNDGQLAFEWGHTADSFAHNQLVARCEGRFSVAVPRPPAVVKITLPA